MITPVLFFRGINTFADDHLHFGPVPLWKMGRNIQKHVHRPERQFILVKEMGCSTFEEEAARAEKFIRHLKIDRFHILAHSAGGIVSKMLLQKPSMAERVLSLTTIGTPHQGSFLAEMVDELTFVSYTQSRKSLFYRLRPDQIKKISSQLTIPRHIHQQSVLCSSTQQQFSLPLKFMARFFKDYKMPEEGDGFVELSSQKFGKVLGHFELDHLEEIGIILRMNPRHRRAHFRLMLDTINTSWQEIESMLA